MVLMDNHVTYSIRQVSVKDADRLHQTCWPHWSVDSIAELLLRVEKLTQQGRGYGIIALNAEVGILGYGQLTVWPRTTEISDLIVAPAYRNQGIGTAIICALIEKVYAWGLSQVEIGAALSNPRALLLYRRLGFQEDRTIGLDLGDGYEPVMYLTRQLERPPKADENDVW